ncbi:MAG: hypothetical protein ACYTF7_09585 [Planctomycetota bacterium]|jgi:hypothetical protein
MKLSKCLTAFGVASLALGATTAAHADTETFGFVHISNNSGESGDIATNLAVDISDEGVGPNQVSFTFYWTGDPSGSISEIYFDDGSLLGIAAVDDSDPGVEFNDGGSASPGDLPGGNSFTLNGSGPYTFQTTQFFLAESDGSNANAVQMGESVTIIFDLIDGQTFADVIDAMNNAFGIEPGASEDPIENTGGLVIGLHVRGIGDNDDASDSFITVPGDGSLIPLPMTFGLGMAGLAPIALRRRRTL